MYQVTADGESFIQYAFNTAKTSALERSKFSINLATGIVSFIGSSLDYENGDRNFDLYVSAKSSNLVGRNDFHLIINVMDVNDNSPVFASLSYSFSVDEGNNLYFVNNFKKYLQ